MRRNSSYWSLLMVLVVVAVSLLGCNPAKVFDPSDKEPDPELQAVVNVEDPDYGGETPITVTVSSKSYRDGVGKLRTQKWAEAIEFFQAKTEDESNRERLAEAYFAMGVAYEAQGNYAEAVKAYEEAFERANRAEYQDGMNRARTGLGSN